MDERKFWRIMGLLDWEKADSDSVLEPAVRALSQLPDEDIFRFDDLLAEKLYALDGERFAPPGEDYFSVDGFLYARCAVVASGQDFYEAVLQDPAKMDQDEWFEPLLSLPHDAWHLKHGEQTEYPHFHEVWYETFSNPEGWPGIIPLKDRVLGYHEEAC